MRISASTFPLALLWLGLVVAAGASQAQTEPTPLAPPPPLEAPATTGETETATADEDGATLDYRDDEPLDVDEAPDSLDPIDESSDPSALDDVEIAPAPSGSRPRSSTVPPRPAPKSASPYAVKPAFEEAPVDGGVALPMPFDSAVLVPGLIGMGVTMVLPAGAVAIGLVGILGSTQGWFSSNPNDACATFILSTLCVAGGSALIGPAGFIGTNVGSGVGIGLAHKEWAPLWAGLAAGVVTFGLGAAATAGAWTLGSSSGGNELVSNIFIGALVASIGVIAISGPVSLVASLATEFLISPTPAERPLEALELAVPVAPRVALPTKY